MLFFLKIFHIFPYFSVGRFLYFPCTVCYACYNDSNFFLSKIRRIENFFKIVHLKYRCILGHSMSGSNFLEFILDEAHESLSPKPTSQMREYFRQSIFCLSINFGQKILFFWFISSFISSIHIRGESIHTKMSKFINHLFLRKLYILSTRIPNFHSCWWIEYNSPPLFRKNSPYPHWDPEDAPDVCTDLWWILCRAEQSRA